jgi:hypothetical protein
MVAFMIFYKRGSGVAYNSGAYNSLLQYYDLELHNLTPLGILHIATFVTPCKTFM